MSKHLPRKENSHLKMPEAKKSRKNIPDSRLEAREHPDFGFTKRNIIETAVSAVLFAAACVIPAEGMTEFAVFIVPFLAATHSVFIRAAERCAAREFFNESVIVILASVISFAVGQFAGGAAVMVFYRGGTLIEAAAGNINKKMYAEMRKRLPESVSIETDEGVVRTQPQSAAVDDIYRAEAGEMLGLDGVVIEGMSALDASALTGTAENITVNEGARVYSGCVNISAPLRIKAKKIFAESTATRVCDALESAPRYKSGLEKVVARFERIYTPAAVVLALVFALIPPIFGGAWKTWISRGVIFLVLANTYAMTATTAQAYLGAIAVAAKNGVVIKGTRFVEALSRIRTMIFNKTGTLTEGKYIVTDIVPKEGTEIDLLRVAAAGEQKSQHPIARAICAAAGIERGGDDIKTEEIAGRGVSTIVHGRHIYVGNAALLEEQGIHCDVPKRGGLAIHVALDDKYLGYIHVADKVREGAFDSIEALRVMGVEKTVMLTADVRSVSRPVASALNFEMVKPEQSLENKISAVEYLLATKAERSSLAYVCDKASDADALERADVGISIAALGSESSLDRADVLIMADDIRFLPETVRIARNASNAALYNTVAFIALRVIMLIFAVSGLLSVVAAAGIDLAATVLMFANSYRTVYKKY